MKKILSFTLTLMLLLSSCATHPVAPAAGDFTLCPPDGYTVENITDLNATLLREEDATVVGGMEVTAMSPKVLKEDHAKTIMLYLQEDFHKTNNVEYITSHWGNHSPIVTVHLRKYEVDDTETMFSHIFFSKDSRVYHIWLNEDVAGEDAADAFIGVLQ